MTIAEPTERSTWPRLGWWAAILVVLAIQFGFIFALGRRTETPPRQKLPTPNLNLWTPQANAAGRPVTAFAELLPLRDPTLFILPHREGFSGQAWLQDSPLPARSYTWTEPENWLALRAEKLGAVFTGFMQTNDFANARFEIFPKPSVTEPNMAPPEPLLSRSSMQVKGDLAGRTIASQPDAPSLPGTDLLVNSYVQVLVDANGNVLSATLTQDPGRSPVLSAPGSGSADADRLALELAKSVRFAPLPQKNGPAKVTVGIIVFEWQTVPMPNNSPDK